METIDGWKRPLRRLTHEFGFVIMEAMVDEGHRDPLELYDILEVRRERLQAAWLATNYITQKTRDIFQAALDRSRR